MAGGAKVFKKFASVRKKSKKRKVSGRGFGGRSPAAGGFGKGLNRKTGSMSGLTTIKVIGVGGGGGNAVSRMMEGDRIRGVEFIAANTDAQDLNCASAHRKIYMGRALTRGLGSGMNPEIGKQAAEESRSEIGEALENADIVFITAGMGGGTGTGASPIVAEVARERGILTVAIVTKPFSFEGTQRMSIAQDGLIRLKEKVDTMVVIPNDRIFAVIDKDASIARAFGYIDDLLKNAVQGVAELINVPGIINVDFSDIKAVMREAGTSLIGIGVASGQDRGGKAVRAAITSPLLDTSIEGARGVLFAIAGGRDLKMSEVNDVAKAISGAVDPGAKVIFGAYYDRKLKDKALKVTVIATGFNNNSSFGGRGFEVPNLFQKKEGAKDDFLESLYKNNEPDKERGKKEASREEKKRGNASVTVKGDGGGKDGKETESADDGMSWDIPAFLRKRKR